MKRKKRNLFLGVQFEAFKFLREGLMSFCLWRGLLGLSLFFGTKKWWLFERSRMRNPSDDGGFLWLEACRMALTSFAIKPVWLLKPLEVDQILKQFAASQSNS